MTEPNSEPVGLSLEDLHFPEPTSPAAPAAVAAAPLVVPDAELPDSNGVVEVTGQRIDVGPLLAAERKRVRESTEARVRAEYEPVKRQAESVSRLEAELNSLKQQIVPPKPPSEPDVPDAEAETYARRHQLYNSDSQLDLKTAKSIISENRADLRRVAQESVETALRPIQQSETQRTAHDNFMRIAATKDAEGDFVFKDPSTHQALLDAWNALPDNLRAVPEVGDVVVKSALGELALRGHKHKAAVVAREPVLSESAGVRGQSAYTMSALEKKLAAESNMSESDFEKRAKTYQPGQPNSLE